MPIRKKLLLLLLAIALLPLLLASWHAHIVTRNLGLRLAARGMELATERFSRHLRLMVESSEAFRQDGPQHDDVTMVVVKAEAREGARA